MITDTKSNASITGKTQVGPQLYRRGSDTVRATATTRVIAIGQRFSPRTSVVVIGSQGAVSDKRTRFPIPLSIRACGFPAHGFPMDF